MRFVFVKIAAQQVAKPTFRNHGIQEQAISHPRSDAIPVSIPRGMIVVAITPAPTQRINKNMGCEALTTRESLWKKGKNEG